jgi:hypothetical protein
MKLSDEMAHREFDPKAETIAELMQATGYKWAWVAHYAKDQVAAGKWEKVWRIVNGRPTPAYRRKKN